MEGVLHGEFSKHIRLIRLARLVSVMRNVKLGSGNILFRFRILVEMRRKNIAWVYLGTRGIYKILKIYKRGFYFALFIELT